MRSYLTIGADEKVRKRTLGRRTTNIDLTPSGLNLIFWGYAIVAMVAGQDEAQGLEPGLLEAAHRSIGTERPVRRLQLVCTGTQRMRRQHPSPRLSAQAMAAEGPARGSPMKMPCPGMRTLFQ